MSFNSMLCRQIRYFHTSLPRAVKKAGGSFAGKPGKGKGAKAVAVSRPAPIQDGQLLTTRCCGLNKYKDGEDPLLKPDSEYPDWLWTIHIGRPKRYYEMDPNTREYWKSFKSEKMYIESKRNRDQKGFFREPKPYELRFRSRLPLKAPAKVQLEETRNTEAKLHGESTES